MPPLFLHSGPPDIIKARRAVWRDASDGHAATVEMAFETHGKQEWEECGAYKVALPGVVVIAGTQRLDTTIQQITDDFDDTVSHVT